MPPRKPQPMIINSWLSYDIAYQKDAVERIFCVPFHLLPASLSPAVLQAQRAIEADGIAAKTVFFQRWLMDEMAQRMDEYMSVKLDAEALLYIALVSDSVMTAKMYLTYIQSRCRRYNRREVDYSLLKNVIFKNGFPQPSALINLWNKQKVNGISSDNLLDHRAAMRSILF
jgi:hypothetical protein